MHILIWIYLRVLSPKLQKPVAAFQRTSPYYPLKRKHIILQHLVSVTGQCVKSECWCRQEHRQKAPAETQHTAPCRPHLTRIS